MYTLLGSRYRRAKHPSARVAHSKMRYFQEKKKKRVILHLFKLLFYNHYSVQIYRQ